MNLWIEIYTDPKIMDHIGPTLSKEKAIKLFEKVTVENQDNLFYVIRNTHNSQKVGMIGLMTKLTKDSCYELGVMIHKNYSNKGYAYKATQILLKLAFKQMNAHSVSTRCHVLNSGANRISKALGFVNKGIISDGKSARKFNCWEMTDELFKANNRLSF
ncbi:MAG: GNAT family N-acetyltransferase [Xanthomonadales bacterium]|nr:GNAT family N-acetyltransferase [Xanthomonadales bacterium]